MHHQTNKFAIASLAAASILPVCLSTQPATAFVLRGVLTDITFENPLDPLSAVTANGSFDFDTVTSLYSNVNIAISDGVTFVPTDSVTGSASTFLVQKSPTGANLYLEFLTALNSVTPPDSVELRGFPGPGSCFGGLSCYSILGSTPTNLPALAEESIEVTAVPVPPALLGTLLGASLAAGSRLRKKLAGAHQA